MELQGKYGIAKVFTENIEEEAISQIIGLLNQEWLEGSEIAVMPDVHAGKGCTVGTTIKLKQRRIAPALVGVDIGCGMSVVAMGKRDLDLEAIDNFIRTRVPSGSSIRTRSGMHSYRKQTDIRSLKCAKDVQLDRADLSVGTLGGGNHFIEINTDELGNKFLVVHSGSRHLGLEVCGYYTNIGYKKLVEKTQNRDALVKQLQKEGRHSEIQAELKKLPKVELDRDLAYVEGEDFDNYIHDMQITQRYAQTNRHAIVNDICRFVGVSCYEVMDTIHNYIDEDLILRKGAISAKGGQIVLIPLNMRDGSLLCQGKGNTDWNESAPHGAGRIMSRSKAKQFVNIDEFKESMKDVYTSSVSMATLDEAPMVYKDAQEIIDAVGDTVNILYQLKPIYNFKAN